MYDTKKKVRSSEWNINNIMVSKSMADADMMKMMHVDHSKYKNISLVIVFISHITQSTFTKFPYSIYNPLL